MQIQLLAPLNHSLRSVGVINHPNPVRKNCVRGSIGVGHTSRTVGEPNFLTSIGMVIFDLFVRKMICLHSILMGNLGGLFEVKT